MKKIAVPTVNGILCPHFGHCESFMVYHVENNEISSSENFPAPPHQPGLLPKWLGEKGIDMVLAGGMGQKAITLFNAQNIEVAVGAPAIDPQKAVEDFLSGNLQLAGNACDH